MADFPESINACELFQDLVFVIREFRGLPKLVSTSEATPVRALPTPTKYPCILRRMPKNVSPRGTDLLDICGLMPMYWNAKARMSSSLGRGIHASELVLHPETETQKDEFFGAWTSDDGSTEEQQQQQQQQQQMTEIQDVVRNGLCDWRHVRTYNDYGPQFYIGKRKKTNRWVGAISFVGMPPYTPRAPDTTLWQVDGWPHGQPLARSSPTLLPKQSRAMDPHGMQHGAVEVQTAEAPETAHIVFLTINDIYKLQPTDDGMGGVAQFGTLLDMAKAKLPADAHVIITLNGDFLWRSDVERNDKAELMIQVLEAYGVDYVVLGNHEFDFGVERCLELIPTMRFTVFGSNARAATTDRALLPGLCDYKVIRLPHSGLCLGLFGVLTSNIHEYTDFPGDDTRMVLESEVIHAKRCVQQLQANGAQVIVALTHTRLPKDRLIARQVPGIHLILGGHDHEPSTLFESKTLIQKSGCDAKWLAQVELFISVHKNQVDVQYAWQMMPNRGYPPKPQIQQLLDEYLDSKEPANPKMEMPLAVLETSLDGTLVSVRSHECTLGYLVADAMRHECHEYADVAFINAGFLQGARVHSKGLTLTRSWLQEVLPIPNIAQCISVRAKQLKNAFLSYLRKYPDLTAMMPHVSGVFVVATLTSKGRELALYRDKHHTIEIQDDELLKVVSSPFIFEKADGKEFFQEEKTVLADFPVIRDLVANYLVKLRNGKVTYPLQREGRFVINEE